MTATTTAGGAMRLPLWRPRSPVLMGRCDWCSFGHFPAMHAQRVDLNLFAVIEYREPVGFLVNGAIALRALPTDEKLSILNGQPRLQRFADQTYVSVRDVASVACSTSRAARHWTAESVSVCLAQGLVAAAAVVGHAATCSDFSQRSACRDKRRFPRSHPGCLRFPLIRSLMWPCPVSQQLAISTCVMPAPKRS